jgi:glycine/D-amino acid oxidase-like deaminating enzyme
MADRYDVLVVGAGGVGLATALELARRGLSVVVIDKAMLASQTSARAAGMLSLLQSDSTRTQVVQRAVELIDRFEEDHGVPLPHTRAGTVKLARGDRCARYVEADIERGRRFGVPVRLINATEAEALAPYLSLSSGVSAISYVPGDLYFEPEDLLRALLQGAGRAGVEFRPHCALVRLEAAPRTTVAITTDGAIFASAVVDAAGAWGPHIAEEAGTSVPVVPTRHQLVVTTAIDTVDKGQPAVTVVDDNVYMRPCRAGLLLGGYESDPVQIPSESVGIEFTLDDVELDDLPLVRMRQAVTDLVPCLATTGIAELRGGLPTMTPDNMFIVDKISDKLNLYIVSGCCVSGLSTSLCIGEAVAAWVSGDLPLIDLKAFSLRRFPSMHEAFDRLREKTAWQYAHHQEVD